MCHQCDDDGFDGEMSGIPAEEMEQFIDYACMQVLKIIHKAEDKGFLYELITEWPREKQAAFALATVLEGRLNGILNDEEGEY
jgi:hypothetical protein